MRILPDPFNGLHPAFPAWPEDSRRNRAGTLGFIPVAGVLPCTLEIISSFWKRHVLLAASTKAAAYLACGLGLATAAAQSHSRWRERSFLRIQGIEVPKGKMVDRVGFFDLDDAILSGGILALLVSSARRNPSNVLGWKRYLGTFTIGGTYGLGGMLMWNSCENYKTGVDKVAQMSKRDQEVLEQRKKWMPIVNSQLLQHSAESALQTIGRNKQTAGVPGVVNPNAARSPSGGASGSHGSGLQPQGSGPVLGTEILNGGPHTLLQHPDSPEPIPRPETNYQWTSEHEIEDLEEHIGKLRERRQRLAQESELLWAWLSEKEAEYYNSSESKTDATNTSYLQRYLKVLSASHRKTWEEVSMLDWMIADSKKRVKQRRSALDSQGQVTWRATPPDTSAVTVPSFALVAIRGFVGLSEAHEAQALQNKTAMAMRLADPDWDGENQIFHPVKQKMMSEKEVYVDIEKALDEQLKELAADRQVCKEIMADSEKRARAHENSPRR